LLHGTELATSEADRGAMSLDGIAAKPRAAITTAHPYFWAPFILMGNWL
jgi:CHAT domain-containing protein